MKKNIGHTGSHIDAVRTPGIHPILCILLLVTLLSGCSSGSALSVLGSTTDSNESTEAQSTSSVGVSGLSDDILQVQVLKIGKADAMVLMCGDNTMVIDCGEEEDGQEVLDYLKSRGREKVDVLLITHYDKDHVGGADTVVEGIPVERVLMPAYTGTGSDYSDFVIALQNEGITPENVTETLNFELGTAQVTVEPPASYEVPENATEYDNNFSLITTVEFLEKRLVFTGDIEKQRIREWLDGGTVEKCDVLKVPHHGLYNTELDELFKTLQPDYAIICDSEKNAADDRTVELLKGYGADCLETKDGDVTIICSKAGIEIQQD